MFTIIYILIGFFIGYFIFRLITWPFSSPRLLDAVKEEENKLNNERAAKAEEARNKVMELFHNKEEITNDDVQALLGVSHSTATRYLDDLEKEGKVHPARTALIATETRRCPNRRLLFILQHTHILKYVGML